MSENHDKPKVIVVDTDDSAIQILRALSMMASMEPMIIHARDEHTLSNPLDDTMGKYERKEARRKNKPFRPCLNCKVPHQHDNSYCSPECCKEHRAKKK